MRKTIPTFIAVIVVMLFIGGIAKSRSATVTTVDALRVPQATQALVTPTKQPLPTVDYQRTAQAAVTQVMVAQATSNEAARINAQATTVYRQLEDNKLQATRETDQRSQQRLEWTATAMQTSIPLTATAQVVNGTAIANYQAMQAAQMTATYAAPQILIDMKNAQAHNAVADFWVGIIANMALAFFFFSASFILLFFPRKSKPTAAPAPVVTYPRPMTPSPAITETVIRVERTGSFPNMDRMVIPCEPDKFTVFVKGVLNEGIPLSYKYWESKDSPFVRDEYTQLRLFMQSNRLAQSAGGGSLILSAEGESLFIEWLNRQQLPEKYKFGQQTREAIA